METISLNRYKNNYIYIPIYNVSRDVISFVCCLEDIPLLYKYAKWDYNKETYRFIKYNLDKQQTEIYDCLAGYILGIEQISQTMVDTDKTILDTKKYLIDVYGEKVYNIFVR